MDNFLQWFWFVVVPFVVVLGIIEFFIWWLI